MHVRRILTPVLFLAIVGVTLLPVGADGSDATSRFLNTAAFEDRIFDAINRERASNNIPPLLRAADLNGVAREHSGEMLERNYFNHSAADGATLQTRFARRGITNWRRIAENISSTESCGPHDPVPVAIEGWMSSQHHRENILDRRLTETGIGVAVDAKGRTFITQVFAKREK